LAWTIEYSADARKALAKLDGADARRVLDYMDRVKELDDPCLRGKALTGNLSGLWRYRVGDWRVICIIDRGRLVILALDVVHRSTAYRGQVRPRG